MNNRFRSLFSALLVLVLLLSCAVNAAQAGDGVTVDVSAKFLYSEARSMLDLINNFRTGSDAYYVDKDNKTQVQVKGLKKLQYDYNLEKTAMLRALEIAVLFSHTRPNGKKWSTAHSGSYTRGENIAYGYGSASAAFKGFREDKKNYSGQGHRRNMLQSGFTRVGFGCVKVGNTVYWAQEFSSGKAGGSSSQKFSARTVDASWKTLSAGKTKISVSANKLTLAQGESVDLPKVILVSNSGAKNGLHQPQWKSSNSKIAKVNGSKIVGVKAGKVNLTVDVNGTALKVAVQVTKKSGKGAATEILEDYGTPLGSEDTGIFFPDDEEAAYEEAGATGDTDE